MLNRGIVNRIWLIIIIIIRLVQVATTELDVHQLSMGATSPVNRLWISCILFLCRLAFTLVALISICTYRILGHRVWRAQIILFFRHEKRRCNNH